MRRVFLTSQSYDGNLGGLAGADAVCAALRSASSLHPGTFKAWLSTQLTNAASRMTHTTGPYADVLGVRIANDWTDLTDGTLAAAITRDEHGTTHIGTGPVWTDTNTDGTTTSVVNCLDWTTNDPSPFAGGQTGLAGTADGHWTHDSAQQCATLQRLYCIEQ